MPDTIVETTTRACSELALRCAILKLAVLEAIEKRSEVVQS